MPNAPDSSPETTQALLTPVLPAPPRLATTIVPAVPTAEFGGPGGPDPTRYGDWERAGRCIDF